MDLVTLKRPPSVWISQIVLILVSLIFVAAALYLGLVLLTDNIRVHMWSELRPFFITTVIAVIYTLPSAVAVMGMAFRKSFGRWLGGIILCITVLVLCLAIFGNIILLVSSRGAGPILLSLVLLLTEILIAAGLTFLFIRLMFAKRVTEFFGPAIRSNVPSPTSTAQTSTDS